MKRRRSSSHAAGVPERLDALAQAAELAQGRLDPTAVDAATESVTRIRGRLRHGTERTVVALLGATGSGKSSLTNAIVGDDIATTGVRRPTTSSTLACVWGPEPSTELLDWLDVPNRHVVRRNDDRLDGLILLDVPDHDSVAVSHRLEMERIATHADLLVWVTDPEKYADAALHAYLRQLAGHQAVMVLVLNKVDRIDNTSPGRRQASPRQAVLDDLTRLVADDGISNLPVVGVSTTDGSGVDDLVDVLASAIAERRAALVRAAAEVTIHADQLLAAAGGDSSAEVTVVVGDRLAEDLAEAAGIGIVAEAVEAGHRRDAAARTGWPFTRWIGRLRPHPLRRLRLGADSAGRTSLPGASGAQITRARAAIRDTTDAIAADLPDPWPARLRRAGTPDDAVLRDRLDEAVAVSTRRITAAQPRWWGGVARAQLLLALAAVAGALWLAGLAVFGYLQLPPPPTPRLWSVPVPTGLLLGGLALGWVLALLSRRLAAIGGRRAAKRARTTAAESVRSVAQDLVLDPLEQELADRRTILDLLAIAHG